MKLAVITDSSAFLPAGLTERSDLFVIDIPIVFGEESYFEGKTISLDDFYDKMRASRELPRTSQPSLATLVSILEGLPDQGYTHVLGLFLSSGISGFWQNIQYLPEEFDQLTIAFPDTKITSSPLGNLIEAVFASADQGQDFETILADLEARVKGTTAFIMVDDLNHLVKGGRLSNGSALLGNLLSIKPILYFNDQGVIEIFDKVRTEKKAMKKLAEILTDYTKGQPYRVSIIHSRAQSKAEAFYQLLQAEGFGQDLTIVPFCGVIATHLGEGAIAIGLSPKD